MKVIWEGFARSWSVIKNNMLHQPRSSSQMSPAPSTQHVVWQRAVNCQKTGPKRQWFPATKLLPSKCLHLPSPSSSKSSCFFDIQHIQLYFLVANLKQTFILLFHTKTIHHFSHKKTPFETTVNSLPPVNACAPKGGRFSPGKGAAVGGKVTGGNGLSVGKSWSTLHRIDEGLVFAWWFGFLCA